MCKEELSKDQDLRKPAAQQKGSNFTEVCSADLRTRTELVSLQCLGVTENMPQSQWLVRLMRWCLRDQDTAVPSRGRHEANLQKGWLGHRKAGEGSSRCLSLETEPNQSQFPKPHEKICCLILPRGLLFFA